jgi:hypothetical protein
MSYQDLHHSQKRQWQALLAALGDLPAGGLTPVLPPELAREVPSLRQVSGSRSSTVAESQAGGDACRQ